MGISPVIPLKKRGGVSDFRLDVRKGGGVIQMRTVCNKGGGGV